MVALSIVIPSHSRADLLAICLRTVTHFAPSQTEILVVDDGSPGAIVSRTAEAFPGVRVERLRKQSGFCVAANTGVRTASGCIVELLNDDTEVTAGWADAALRWFADPRVGAVAPLVLQRDPLREQRGLPPRIDSAGDEYDSGGFAWKRWHGEALASGERVAPGAVSQLGAYAPRTPGSVWGASATAAFYRRAAILSAGGFPEEFGAYFEDVDLSFRLRRLGYDIWYDPTSVVWHRVSASYGRRPSRQVMEQQSRNEEAVFWRNRSRGNWHTLSRHAAVLGGKALLRFGEGTLTPWLCGRVRAWAEILQLPS